MIQNTAPVLQLLPSLLAVTERFLRAEQHGATSTGNILVKNAYSFEWSCWNPTGETSHDEWAVDDDGQSADFGVSGPTHSLGCDGGSRR